MATLIAKLKNMFSADEYDEGFDYENADDIDEESEMREEPKRINNVASFDQFSSERYVPRRYSTSSLASQARIIGAASKVEVVISSPKTLEEAGSVCVDLRAKKATVVNLETVDYETAQRISDFLSGAAYALEAKVEVISDMIFIIGPVNFDITGEFKNELKANGIKLPTAMWR